MTAIEYYEKHWTINGEKPPPLTSWQRRVLEWYENVRDLDQRYEVIHIRGRMGSSLMYKVINDFEKRDGKN